MRTITNAVSGSGIGADQAIFRITETLTFTNLVATVTDARITATDGLLIYYSDDSIAQAAGVTAAWSAGSVTFTATSAPSSTLSVTIYDIKPALANVWDNISASEVSYGSSTVAAALDDKVSKSGDTMTGTLTINTGSGESHAVLGGSNSNGVLELKSKTNNKTMYILPVDLANNHAIQFPDKDGTVALTSDIPTIKTVNETITANAYRWVMFPAGRIVLSATVYDTSNVVQLMLDPDTNSYRARWYINMNTTSFGAELFSANTGYSITYQYIDV